MAPSFLQRSVIAALMLCLAAACPAFGSAAQEKLQVAPPSKSDTFAEDEHGRKSRVQHRDGIRPASGANAGAGDRDPRSAHKAQPESPERQGPHDVQP